MTEWTLSSFHHKAYGQWGGNPRGTRPDPARCAESVTPNERGPIPHQCYRKRGYGPEQAYCSVHDPERVAKKRAERDAREREAMAKRRIEWEGHRMFAALCQIADGDNDPRAIAAKAIEGLRSKGDGS